MFKEVNKLRKILILNVIKGNGDLRTKSHPAKFSIYEKELRKAWSQVQ